MENKELLEKGLGLQYLKESYKLYWFHGLLKEVEKGNIIIPKKIIAINMIIDSWDAVSKYDLKIGKNDKLSHAINFLIKEGYSKESGLQEILFQLEDKEFEKLLEGIYKWVQFRFLTPFYEKELKGVTDSKRNKLIDELSKKSNIFYSIGNENIHMNAEAFKYLKKYSGSLKFKFKNNLEEFLLSKNSEEEKVSSYINNL